MRILIDTCVLYPTVMREILLGVAQKSAFVPLWSERILEEWARAARNIGPMGEAQARAEIALVSAAFPQASVHVPEGAERRFWLPDEADVHVLAAAVAGSADAIMTVNVKDFPRATLLEDDLERLVPDGYLYRLWLQDAALVEQAAQHVLDQAQRMSGRDWEMRALLKKARLPRLAKALAQV